jgi:mannan endo-1,4-beta-mannosidase
VLWDSTYKVTKANGGGWPADVYATQVILHRIQKSIDQWYPGVKIGITEYYFGGTSHISGGIAQADFYGIAAAHGLQIANLHTNTKPYLVAATKLFQDYDGNGSGFGDVSVFANSNDRTATSVWASISSKDSSLHIIAINKERKVNSVRFNVDGTLYTKADVFGFDSTASAIKPFPVPGELLATGFDYELPALSALHFILKREQASSLLERSMVRKLNGTVSK